MDNFELQSYQNGEFHIMNLFIILAKAMSLQNHSFLSEFDLRSKDVIIFHVVLMVYNIYRLINLH